MNFNLEYLKNQYKFLKTICKEDILPYTIGALLYSPATNHKIAAMICANKIKSPYSLALCLEDSINDNAVAQAENQIYHTFKELSTTLESGACPDAFLPNIFIRVRYPKQVLRVFQMIEPYHKYLTGFIFPKYSVDCSEEYNECLKKVNQFSMHKLYMMPIIESPDIISMNTRYQHLDLLHSQLMEMSEYVLNVRVGGNDFCKHFGIRRAFDESIYEILAVSNILSDIITTFSSDFVVSGPVYEYFAGDTGNWESGLKRELKYDRLNGFIGKTVIHPNQIPAVNESLAISQKDVDDALEILEFENSLVQVSKNSSGERMNEVKTHLKWAYRSILLASVYGVKHDEHQ